jgi:di/tricarboxylate transporter
MMSVELLSILILGGVFLVATVWHIHMGALAIAAAFVLGMWVLPGEVDAKVDQIAGGFPGDLFVVLAGVTYLFAIARNNGTVDWLVQAALRSVRGRVALVPWVMFFVTAAATAMGAVAPAMVAMLAPVGTAFALRHGRNPVLVGLMIVNAASAGSFSPIGVFGSITNNVVERSGLAGSPTTLFVAVMAFNILLGVIAVALFGGEYRGPSANGSGATAAGGEAAAAVPASDGAAPLPALNLHRTLTIVGLLVLVIGALFFDLDVGFSAFVLAVLLSAVDPAGAKGAVNQIAWPTVLLVCGIVTYVSLMRTLGAVDYLGGSVAAIGTAVAAALAICYIGGVVSAFASTTGILGALIPLAVPLLQQQDVSAIGLIAALAISASVVDSSPFSTSGSLVVANAPEEQRELVYRRFLQWGFSMVALAPLAAWLVLVVSGWL